MTIKILEWPSGKHLADMISDCVPSEDDVVVIDGSTRHVFYRMFVLSSDSPYPAYKVYVKRPSY